MVRAMVQNVWEARAAHSDYRTREEEAHDLDRCIRITEASTSERPYGFFYRGSETAPAPSLPVHARASPTAPTCGIIR